MQTLVQRVDDYGSQDVDAAFRLEVLTKIRDGAGNHYFRAWSENGTAIDITREWLKAALTAKSNSPLVETIMPLLHVSRSTNIQDVELKPVPLDYRSIASDSRISEILQAWQDHREIGQGATISRSVSIPSIIPRVLPFKFVSAA